MFNANIKTKTLFQHQDQDSGVQNQDQLLSSRTRSDVKDTEANLCGRLDHTCRQDSQDQDQEQDFEFHDQESTLENHNCRLDRTNI